MLTLLVAVLIEKTSRNSSLPPSASANTSGSSHLHRVEAEIICSKLAPHIPN